MVDHGEITIYIMIFSIIAFASSVICLLMFPMLSLKMTLVTGIALSLFITLMIRGGYNVGR